MLKLLNTKFLLAILAVLVAIASTAMYQRHEAAKAAAILEQQQRDAAQRKQEDEAFHKKVRPGKPTSLDSYGDSL
jgi:uncharacterized protein YxeA